MTTSFTPAPNATPEHTKLMHDAARLCDILDRAALNAKPENTGVVIAAIGMLLANKSGDAATALRLGEATATAAVAMFNIKQVIT